jgi:hypothetical protein
VNHPAITAVGEQLNQLLARLILILDGDPPAELRHAPS